MAKKKHNEDVILRIIVDESKKIGKNITPEMIVSLCVDVAKNYAELYHNEIKKTGKLKTEKSKQVKKTKKNTK